MTTARRDSRNGCVHEPRAGAGQAVDKRTDIWAFGCVLYEMLTGRRAFAGEDVADALLARDSARPSLGAAARRDSTAHRRRAAVLSGEASTRAAERHRRRAHRSRPRTQSHATRRWRPDHTTFTNRVDCRDGGHSARRHADDTGVALLVGQACGFSARRAVSGDGAERRRLATRDVRLARRYHRGLRRRLAAGNVTTWLRRLGSTEAVTLESARGLTRFDTFWSPDSRQFAFRDGSKLKAADIATGATRVIGEVADTRRIGGTWNRDGIILLGGVNGLVRIPAAGGTPTIVAMNDGDKPDVLRADPQFLPDGHHFLYAVQQHALTWSIHVGDLTSGQSSRLLDAGFYAGTSGVGLHPVRPLRHVVRATL